MLATDSAGRYVRYTFCVNPSRWPVNATIQDHFWKGLRFTHHQLLSYRQLGTIPCLRQTSPLTWLDSGEGRSCLVALPATQVLAIWRDEGKDGKKQGNKIKSVNLTNYQLLGKKVMEKTLLILLGEKIPPQDLGILWTLHTWTHKHTLLKNFHMLLSPKKLCCL